MLIRFIIGYETDEGELLKKLAHAALRIVGSVQPTVSLLTTLESFVVEETTNVLVYVYVLMYISLQLLVLPYHVQKVIIKKRTEGCCSSQSLSGKQMTP